MITHQAVSMQDKGMFFFDLGQHTQEYFPIDLIHENVRPAVSPAHDMIIRSRPPNPRFPRHLFHSPPNSLFFSHSPSPSIFPTIYNTILYFSSFFAPNSNLVKPRFNCLKQIHKCTCISLLYITTYFNCKLFIVDACWSNFYHSA